MTADRYFLDTNVLVYANDSSDARKQEAAVRLITDGIQSGRAVISSQVLGEFWVTVTRKPQVPLDLQTAEMELERFRALRVIGIEYGTVKAALHLQKRHQLPYWDALVLAAAQLSGCARLYSEDMNEGQAYDGLMVANPFSVGARP
jgi:predicted nucleic acid-binding protein